MMDEKLLANKVNAIRSEIGKIEEIILRKDDKPENTNTRNEAVLIYMILKLSEQSTHLSIAAEDQQVYTKPI